MALCTLPNIPANITYTNPDLTLAEVIVSVLLISKTHIPSDCTAYLAQGIIFLASLRLMQNPAPPVANQKRTDFWRETAEQINGRGSDDTMLPELGMLQTQL